MKLSLFCSVHIICHLLPSISYFAYMKEGHHCSLLYVSQFREMRQYPSVMLFSSSLTLAYQNNCLFWIKYFSSWFAYHLYLSNQIFSFTLLSYFQFSSFSVAFGQASCYEWVLPRCSSPSWMLRALCSPPHTQIWVRLNWQIVMTIITLIAVLVLCWFTYLWCTIWFPWFLFEILCRTVSRGLFQMKENFSSRAG